jgi:HEPN domain-containing protein
MPLNNYPMNRENLKAIKNAFVNECLRDMADKDYISARMNYRLELIENFLWSSEQAIEKYLKAILLYNDQDARGLGHSLTTAYEHLSRIKDIKFDFPKGIEKFLAYLETYGTNRYMEIPIHTFGDELLNLDKAVWHVRKYCTDLKTKTHGPKGEVINLFPYNIGTIDHKYYKENPQKLRMFNGYLERVLDSQGKKRTREVLVWKNFFFGKNRKKKIKHFTMWSSSSIPAHYRHPEIYEALKDIIFFPDKVKRDFKK